MNIEMEDGDCNSGLVAQKSIAYDQVRVTIAYLLF